MGIMDEILGPGNGLKEYLMVLGIYAALFVLMRYANPRVELNFKRSYVVLFICWAFGVFIGNYLFYLLGIMSFLPWANNFLHTFVWIGLCLGFLYAGAYRLPWWEQFLLFAIFSLIVKVFEHGFLNTWDHDRFFFVPGNDAYIIGWSLMDGLYPAISALILRLTSKVVPDLVVP